VSLTAYMVRCADGTLYTGVARDLSQRLRQHNGDLAGGAKYTKSRRPVVCVYHHDFESDRAARQYEARVKRMKRGEKMALAGGEG
jgi:putative endonuclease